VLDRVVHVVRRDVDREANAVVAELLDGGQRLHGRPLEQTATVLGVDVETAIRARRTHKQYGLEPVSEDVLRGLLDLARYAPNHHMTQPWRFRVLGPSTRAALDDVVPEKEVAKLRRAPTLVLATAVLTGDPHQDEEDLHAVACAVYAVLLGATSLGLASYWRTPKCFSDAEVRSLLGLADDERVVALIHLGPAVSEPPEKERASLDNVVTTLP
jgi:nitroreductase